MPLKDQVLTYLEKYRGGYLSGQQIAEGLCVTRAAVWKAVKQLQQEGYPIDAVSNRGYALSAAADVLALKGIQALLTGQARQADITALQKVTSTNTLLKESAEKGAAAGTVIVAAEQTAGRGRRGRQFFSPGSTGLYTSVLFRPSMKAEDATMLTTVAAVAMCEAIEEVSGKETAIKWVNDIFMGGRKVCGILTEAAMGMESGTVEYVVVGAGVNLYPPEGGFPEGIAHTAGSVFETTLPDMHNRLCAAFLNRMIPWGVDNRWDGFIEPYKNRSLALNAHVWVLLPDGGKRSATVTEIDQRCRLAVRYDDGSTGLLSSGEISIRLD